MNEGLVSQVEAAEPAMPAPLPPGVPTAAEADGAPASPEDQAEYDKVVQLAGQILHGNTKTSDTIIRMLKQGPQLGEGQAVAQVVNIIMDKAEKEMQGQVPETVILPAADEISDLVLELADESGAFKVTEDVAIKAKGKVVKAMIDTYGIDQAQLQGISQDVTESDISEWTEKFGVEG